MIIPVPSDIYLKSKHELRVTSSDILLRVQIHECNGIRNECEIFDGLNFDLYFIYYGVSKHNIPYITQIIIRN